MHDLLLNRQALNHIEFQFEHETKFQTAGWRKLVGAGGGKLVLKFSSGEVLNVGVQEGDVLFATGDDIHLQRKV